MLSGYKSKSSLKNFLVNHEERNITGEWRRKDLIHVADVHESLCPYNFAGMR